MSLSKSDSKTKINKEKSSSQREISNSEIIAGSGSCSDELKSNKSYEDGSLGLEEGEDGKTKTDDHLPKLISYREMLDAPRELPEPVDITFDYLKLISEELGLIKLCWPDLIDATFEDRTNFPESYLKNNNKEKLLLLYAENFRRQFCFRYPDRKPLLLACDNECGMQKMVCTTLRPTTLPYSELQSWEKCSMFVADHVRYEPLDDPVLIFIAINQWRNDHLN